MPKCYIDLTKQLHNPNKTLMKITALVLAASLVAGLTARAVDWSKLPAPSTQAGVTFTNDILPLFKASCVRCHGPKRPRGGIRLDTVENVLQGGEHGPILKAGDSANSLLVKAVSQLDPRIAMPPKPRARPATPPPGGNTLPNGQPVPNAGANGPVAGKFGPPAKPLTPEQVALVRAWIDQGAK